MDGRHKCSKSDAFSNEKVLVWTYAYVLHAEVMPVILTHVGLLNESANDECRPCRQSFCLVGLIMYIVKPKQTKFQFQQTDWCEGSIAC